MADFCVTIPFGAIAAVAGGLALAGVGGSMGAIAQPVAVAGAAGLATSYLSWSTWSKARAPSTNARMITILSGGAWRALPVCWSRSLALRASPGCPRACVRNRATAVSAYELPTHHSAAHSSAADWAAASGQIACCGPDLAPMRIF